MTAAHVEAGQARGLGIAADRIDLAAVARVAQHDVAEHGEGQEDEHRDRHCPKIRPWPHQTKSGSKPLIGPPSAKSSAAPRKTDMPPSVTTKGGTLSRVIARPWSSPPSRPDRDRGERREIPGVAETSPARPTEKRRRGRPSRSPPRPGREGQQRADGQVDAGGQDDEGHADGEQAVDRHLRRC